MVSRTGYTGDLGYEIWVDAARAVELWDALIDAGTPFGITIDGQSTQDQTVTVRDRDTLKQDRIASSNLVDYLENKLAS